MVKNTLLILTTLLLFSCSENEVDYNKKIQSKVYDIAENKELCMQMFSRILSKAVSQDQDIRTFLKEQALKKIDNGYNIFYPLVKNEKVKGRSFGDLLADFEECKGNLEIIEKSVPLLNIHIPEIGNAKVENLDISDTEIPVLFQNKLYYAGELMDSLAIDEIPGFNLFVVCESSSIRFKNAFTRSANECYINEMYEYVDRGFNPNSINATSTRSSVEYDALDEKYTERGYVPSKDIDPLLIQAYNSSKKHKRATRYLIYYGLNSINQTPTAMRPDIKDCILRFKIAQDAFSRFEDIAEGDNKPLFNGSQSNKKSTINKRASFTKAINRESILFFIQNRG